MNELNPLAFQSLHIVPGLDNKPPCVLSYTMLYTIRVQPVSNMTRD